MSSLTGKSQYPDSKIIAAEGDKDEFKLETIELLPVCAYFLKRPTPEQPLGALIRNTSESGFSLPVALILLPPNPLHDGGDWRHSKV